MITIRSLNYHPLYLSCLRCHNYIDCFHPSNVSVEIAPEDILLDSAPIVRL